MGYLSNPGGSLFDCRGSLPMQKGASQGWLCPGGGCWADPCRPLNQGQFLPPELHRAGPGPAPGCSSHHYIPGSGPGPTLLPTGQCSALSIIPMAPLGHPRAGTDPGCFQLTMQLSGYNPLSGFSEAQGHHTKLNKWRKKATESF